RRWFDFSWSGSLLVKRLHDEWFAKAEKRHMDFYSIWGKQGRGFVQLSRYDHNCP
ncbi:hypothetical protein M419DRAFT_118438, partial [Trichoderma reesei RUT C-30]